MAVGRCRAGGRAVGELAVGGSFPRKDDDAKKVILSPAAPVPLSAAVFSATSTIRRFLISAAVFLACAAGLAAPASAGLRDYPFRVEQVKGARYFELVAHNQGPATMTLYMTISGENIASDVVWPITRAVPPFSSVSLAKLFSEDPKKSGGKIRWTESIQYGDYRAVHSPDAKYRLPYKDGEAHRITQAYGDPLTSHIGHHHQHAVDFAMAEGTAIVASRDGIVVDVTLDYDTGGMYLDLRDKANAVAIQHDDGTIAHYGHLSKRRSPVTIGQHVTAGTVIGYAGNTGYSSGPHLHYAVTKPEVLADGRVVHVALPVKFYVDTWTLPFEPRRGALVTASYSQDAAMRAAKAPADAGQKLSPEPPQASLIPVKALPVEASGHSATASEASVAMITNAAMLPEQAAAVPVQRTAVALVVEPAPLPPSQVSQPAQISAQHPVDHGTPGLLEAALVLLAGAFTLAIPAFFWKQARA